MAKTRGVFALIMNYGEKRLLLSERQDGKGWNLPGGKVEDGETDIVALMREVHEETGLSVRVGRRIGLDHVSKDDVSVAYECVVIDGELTATKEAKQHRYVNKEEIRELTLVGPQDRLGRIGRMVWDGFSYLENPLVSVENAHLDIMETAAGCHLFAKGEKADNWWPRLDPFSSTGLVVSPIS